MHYLPVFVQNWYHVFFWPNLWSITLDNKECLMGWGLCTHWGYIQLIHMASLTLGRTLYVDSATATVVFLCLFYTKMLDELCPEHFF